MSNYSDAVLATTPLAYWRMGETGGSTFADSSGNGHTLTLSAGVTLGAAGPLRDGNGAGTFDGTANAKAVTSSGVNTWSGDAAITFEAWIYNAAFDTGGHEIVVSLGTIGHYLSVNASGQPFMSVWNGSQRVNNGTAVLSANRWYHLVGTWAAGDYLRLYVDGALVALANTTVVTGTLSGSPNFFAGCFGGSSLFTSGLLDEVAVYRAALTPAQILTHYRAGTPAGPLSAFPWALFGTMRA